MSCDKSVLINKLRGYLNKIKDDWNYITPIAFYNDFFQKQEYLLIDLRHPKDFEKGHVPGAINIFWLSILDSQNIELLEKWSKNKPIFLICYVGHTSSQVMTLLKILNYNVISIKYGYGLSPTKKVSIAGWLDYGLPMTK